jgi:hypothetical protein
MKATGVKDYASDIKTRNMKTFSLSVLTAVIALVLTVSCRNKTAATSAITGSVSANDTAGLILVGKNMITDIVLKPDTLGDPWEVEKVKGFNGTKMFRALFDHIYDEKVSVFDCREDRILKKSEIKALEKEFDSDLSRIGKIQFTEDWYFDPDKNLMVKKIRSVSFGFAMGASGDMAARYKALFRLKS